MHSTEPDSARQQAGAPSRASELEQVYRDAAPRLWRTIYAYAAGRASVADEAVAEAFARALERADAIRDPVPWLYRTAFRIAAAELRRERAASSWTSQDQQQPEPVGLSALVPALRQLSPAQRAAVVLHYEADLPVHDVARQMGTSVAAVKVHLFRGRRRLSELLGEGEADGG
jgi:RNA polymerase sigma-70 factor, ECF subfamily